MLNVTFYLAKITEISSEKLNTEHFVELQIKNIVYLNYLKIFIILLILRHTFNFSVDVEKALKLFYYSFFKFHYYIASFYFLLINIF